MDLPNDFRQLSRELGADPLLVQGAGGNTSFKRDGVMWIKASGTLLADAVDKSIFVAVDPVAALAELDGQGDGSCRDALVDPSAGLRPSIETTFHAMFPHRFVFHFHSIATIAHAIAKEGRQLLEQKLDGLQWTRAPYRKPGIPLTQAIRDAVGDRPIQIVVLDNHGVIVVGNSIDEVSQLIDEVESRLALPVLGTEAKSFDDHLHSGWKHLPDSSRLACDPKLFKWATSGTYYPDHVVFLGPALPGISRERFSKLPADDFPVPVVLVEGIGTFIKSDATPAQHAMLDCLRNVLTRIPRDWSLDPIGKAAEEELLNWDAEKYRQMLARKDD